MHSLCTLYYTDSTTYSVFVGYNLQHKTLHSVLVKTITIQPCRGILNLVAGEWVNLGSFDGIEGVVRIFWMA